MCNCSVSLETFNIASRLISFLNKTLIQMVILDAFLKVKSSRIIGGQQLVAEETQITTATFNGRGQGVKILLDTTDVSAGVRHALSDSSMSRNGCQQLARFTVHGERDSIFDLTTDE